MKKNFLGVFLSFSMAISLLSGCGMVSTSSSKNESVTVSAKTSAAAATPSLTYSPAANVSQYYTSPQAMSSQTAQQQINTMKIGWNLGNTLDVCNADRDGDGGVDEHAATVDETLWGNVKTTKALFTHLKKSGINAVRIPVTWRDHISGAPDYVIDAGWMNRVEEVVNYAYSQNMYVIINLHHDGGGDPECGAWIRSASTKKKLVFAKYKAIWKQIADRFQNYSDRLIFESMNEVGFDDMDENKAYSLLNELNQTFVTLIRSTGGNNAKRNLLIAGYWTDIEKTCSSLYKMPKDTIKNHEILSVHYYTPWEFCTTNQQKTWGTKEEVSLLHSKINQIYKTYTKKKIPVIIGEYGFGKNQRASCIYFSESLVQYCYRHHIATFLWDNGEQYDRTTMKWKIKGLSGALKRAVSGKKYKVVKKK
jgi:endoglucanase